VLAVGAAMAVTGYRMMLAIGRLPTGGTGPPVSVAIGLSSTGERVRW
jgi:hypothetical protein